MIWFPFSTVLHSKQHCWCLGFIHWEMGNSLLGRKGEGVSAVLRCKEGPFPHEGRGRKQRPGRLPQNMGRVPWAPSDPLKWAGWGHYEGSFGWKKQKPTQPRPRKRGGCWKMKGNPAEPQESSPARPCGAQPRTPIPQPGLFPVLKPLGISSPFFCVFEFKILIDTLVLKSSP